MKCPSATEYRSRPDGAGPRPIALGSDDSSYIYRVRRSRRPAGRVISVAWHWIFGAPQASSLPRKPVLARGLQSRMTRDWKTVRGAEWQTGLGRVAALDRRAMKTGTLHAAQARYYPSSPSKSKKEASLQRRSGCGRQDAE